MGQIRTVIFDLDGTIIDTEPSAERAIQDSFASWGVKLQGNDSHAIVGRTWESAFNHLFAIYDVPLPRPEAERAMLSRYREELEKHLVVVPGAPEAIRAIAARFPIALVSGSHRSEILWALGKLGVLPLFSVVLGAEDYPRSKPAPDGYALALSKLGLTGSDALIFEDSVAGIASARAVGARVVAITSTNHFGHDISGAERSIADLRGVDAEWVATL
jgi:HAD superfamily hydrolase (TIGR01509 family)